MSHAKMKLDLPASEDLPYIETLSLKRRTSKPNGTLEATTPNHAGARGARDFSLPAYSLPPPPPPAPLRKAEDQNTRKVLFAQEDTLEEDQDDEQKQHNDLTTSGYSFESESYDGVFYSGSSSSGGSDFENFDESYESFQSGRRESLVLEPVIELPPAPAPRQDTGGLFYRTSGSEWLLPPQTAKHAGRVCVVLDMDETLVHSEFLDGEDYMYRQEEDRETFNDGSRPDFFLDVCDGVAVRVRPGLTEFLAKLAEHFEVGIFTAAEEVYACPVLDTIDPNGHISFRLYRDATVEHNGVQFVKDLSRLGRDMRRCVLIDNNVQATLASPENSLVCVDYYGDPNDNELQGILAYLHELDQMADIRPALSSRYQHQQKQSLAANTWTPRESFTENF